LVNGLIDQGLIQAPADDAVLASVSFSIVLMFFALLFYPTIPPYF